MPFTISHAAAALPIHSLTRTRLPLAALMIGSMAPDFAYFLPVEYDRVETHSLASLLYFSLPIGLAVWLYFVTVLERPSIAFLPDAWRTRIARSALTPREMGMAAMAVVLGAASHLIWDAFTHSSTPVVEALPGFAERVEIAGRLVPVYFILQVLSSAFGLAVLGLWALNIRRRPALPPELCVPALTPAVNDFERFLAVMFMGATACAVGFFRMATDGFTSSSLQLFVLLIGGMTGAALSWSILAVAIRFRSRAIRMFAQTDAE
jgi:hypothetical protein